MKPPGAPADLATPAANNRRSPWRRRLVIFFTAVILLMVILRAALPLILRSRLESSLNERLTVPAIVGDVDVSVLRGRVFLKSLAIRNPPGFEKQFALRTFDIQLDTKLFSFLTKNPTIEKITVYELELALERDSNKRRNWEILLAEDEDDDDDDDDDEEDEDEDHERGGLIIEYIDFNRLVINVINKEEGRSEGTIWVHTKFEIQDLDFSTPGHPTVRELKVNDISFYAPGEVFNNRSGFDAYGIVLSAISENNYRLAASHFSISLAWKKNGETGLKRMRRILKSVMVETEEKEEEEPETRPSNISPKHSEREKSRETPLPRITSVDIKGEIDLNAEQENGEWKKEILHDVTLNYEHTDDHASISLKGGPPWDKFSFEQEITPTKLALNLKTTKFPFHALLWHEQMQDDFAGKPRVLHALLKSDGSLKWRKGHLQGTVELAFHEVDAEQDTRPLLKRFDFGGGFASGWATILNDQRMPETNDTRPIILTFDDEVPTSNPIILMTIIKNRFHEARLKPAP